MFARGGFAADEEDLQFVAFWCFGAIFRAVDIFAQLRNIAYMKKIKTPSSLRDFDAWRRYLRGRILAARKRETKADIIPLVDTEWGAARFHIYGYYFRLDEAGYIQVLIDHLGPRPGPRAEGANHLLRLVSQPTEILHPSKKSRMARDLELALMYNIKPKIVLGFLSEVGSQKAMFENYSSKIHWKVADRYS